MKKIKYQPVDRNVNFVELEKKWLLSWETNGLVNKYLNKNSNAKKKFWFLDGPITANNPMALHHSWGRIYKDLWQRYKNMQGFKQTFINGFDNQGLWVEVGVEKELGFKSKKDIENYGIDRFIDKCKETTVRWAAVQTEQSKKLGYFMRWDKSYYTLSDENNYSIWYFLKKCHERGLIYKGRDSVPWCPRCGTAISQHEILEEGYHELTHDSIYFELPVVGKKKERFLVWTTTPWTLPGNVALAVNPTVDYALVKGSTGLLFWLAKSLVVKLFGDNTPIIDTVKGIKLVGLKYTAPFDFLPAVLDAKKQQPKTFHTIVPSEILVSESEGTGIVHIASGCGTEDFALGKETNLPVIAVIDEEARYLEGFGELTGKNAKNDPDIILKNEALSEKSDPENFGYIFEIKPFLHRYPLCWRCKAELVWRVVDEWYIAMDPLRKELMQSAKRAKWLPNWAIDRELDWLKNMGDWMISKKRYWGLALPFWECDKGHFEVIGGKDELKQRAIDGWDQFEGYSPHRTRIDKVMIKCTKCGGRMKRILDVGNPWLDAGIVGYSTLIDPDTKQVSYLTDKKYWREWFPADFVVEAFPGQFRNWFYAILTMSTVLEDRPPFKTLLGHASVFDEKGQIMHKSAGNAIWFDEGAEKIGVDVMRWMFAIQNPDQNLLFGYHIADDTRRRFHLMLWNIYNFYISNAIANNFQSDNHYEKPNNSVDQWLISRLNNLIGKVTTFLDNYDAYNSAKEIELFVQDFSNWYIRRSRDRANEGSVEFLNTAAHTLITLSKLLAPFIPFLSEEIYTNLTGEESVHLTNWPKSDEKLIEIKLEQEMAIVRKICEVGHAKRKELGIKVRQPLAEFKVQSSKFKVDGLVQLIKDELNVKEVIFSGTPSKDISVELDTNITPELKAEGEARDIMRLIQEARKEAGCDIKETVRVGLLSWPKEWEEEIKKRTLASELFENSDLDIVRR